MAMYAINPTDATGGSTKKTAEKANTSAQDYLATAYQAATRDPVLHSNLSVQAENHHYIPQGAPYDVTGVDDTTVTGTGADTVSVTPTVNGYDSQRSILQEAYTKALQEGNTSLSALYKDALAALDAEKKTQQQNADVLYQRAQKYLPVYLRSLGLSRSGVTETAALQANNTYQAALAKIGQYYTQKQNEMTSERANKLSSIQESALKTYLSEISKVNEAEAAANAAAAQAQAQTGTGTGTETGTEEAENTTTTVSGRYATLERYKNLHGYPNAAAALETIYALIDANAEDTTIAHAIRDAMSNDLLPQNNYILSMYQRYRG